MMLRQIITDDEAEWEFLKLANEKEKFALQIGTFLTQEDQDAFERGIDNDWFTLVDVSPVAHAPGNMVMRIFKLTAAGRTRRDELKTVFAPR